MPIRRIFMKAAAVILVVGVGLSTVGISGSAE
jgi:hypothetical protein